MIGLCTDSSSQLPASLAQRFGVEIVPLTVVVGDREHLEGVDLDADEFYERLGDAQCPAVSTTHPSPGQFALAYDELAARGCTEILSVHAASSPVSTISSARLAVHCAPVPVRLVETGTAGFGLSCCVWVAGEVLASGASLDDAASTAELLAPSIGSVFVTGLLGDGVPVRVHRFRGTEVEPLGCVADAAEALDVVASGVIAGGPARVGIGIADRATLSFAAALEREICAKTEVADLVRYRIGPSVGAHTGAGTVSCVTFPAS